MSSVSFIVRPSDSPLHLTSQSVSIGRARDSNMHRAILHRASKVGTCERTGAALVLVVYLRHVGDCSFSRRTFETFERKGCKGDRERRMDVSGAKRGRVERATEGG